MSADLNHRDVVLIVPTIREESIKRFLREWCSIGIQEYCHTIVVMEDNPTKTFDLNSAVEQAMNISIDKTSDFTWPNLIHLCWEDIESELDSKSWIIPRRSDTVRSFAYWYVWAHHTHASFSSHRTRYVLTLDDDCYPPNQELDGLSYEDAGDLILTHKKMLSKRTRWFNTLNSVKPRGIPFYELGERDDVIVNHGLWLNVPDYDAPTQLVQPTPERFDGSSKLVPRGSYFPMCGMNVMWRIEYTVLMYHLLMGHMMKLHKLPDGHGADLGDIVTHELEKLPFDRFGDIWCGIFMKKIADLINLSVSTGIPYIRHDRASNPFTNLKKEANGIEVNEKFWQFVDSFKLYDGSITKSVDCAATVYWYLGDHMQNFEYFEEHISYFTNLGQAMKIWANLFER